MRIYGLDFADRLRAARFELQVRSVNEFPRRRVRRHALARPMTNEVFMCRQPGG